MKTLIFSSFVHGQVFEPPVIIDPPNPQAGDLVRVGVFEMFFPPCLGIPQINSINETHSLVVANNDITIDILATTGPLCNPIPFDPAPRVYYELGIFEEGQYSLDVNYVEVSGIPPEFIPPFPLPDIFSSSPFGSLVTFTVKGVPQAVDALSWLAVFVMLASFLILTNKITTNQSR